MKKSYDRLFAMTTATIQTDSDSSEAFNIAGRLRDSRFYEAEILISYPILKEFIGNAERYDAVSQRFLFDRQKPGAEDLLVHFGPQGG